jgi:uncharacterized protein (DUF697 family)
MPGGTNINAMNLQEINIPLSIAISVIGAALPVAGSWVLMNWRLKRLEKKEDEGNLTQQQVQQKLIELETTIKFIKERLT